MVRLLRKKGQPIFILMIFMTLLISVPFQPALAALIETETVINPDRVKDTRVLLNQLMAREDVRAALLFYGINPVEVDARVAAMTDDEITTLANTMKDMPAGGGGGWETLALIVLVVVILASFLILSLISGVVYGGIKVYEHVEEKGRKEQEYSKSTPYPAPPRVGPVPSVNPDEPWTGAWKVDDGQDSRVYVLKQTGNSVVSTSESGYRVKAKVYSAMIVGEQFDSTSNNFKAIIADDFLSFKGDINSQTFFTCQKIESKPAVVNVKPSGPWAGKWNVQGASFASGLWALKQEGETVTSTGESYYRVRGKAAGDKFEGDVVLIGGNRKDIKFIFVLSSDGKSFDGYIEETTGKKGIRGIKVE